MLFSCALTNFEQGHYSFNVDTINLVLFHKPNIDITLYSSIMLPATVISSVSLRKILFAVLQVGNKTNAGSLMGRAGWECLS